MRNSTSLLGSLFLPTTLALSMALVGCGDKPAETNTATDGSTDTAAKTDGPVELAEVQELIVNNSSEPPSLDPHKIEDSTSGNVVRQMFVGLVSTDPEGKAIPGMAESWESPDNKVWTFKLRDAKWSNGDPVTAEDFVYSLRRAVDPNTASPYSSYLVEAKVAGAEKIVAGEAGVDTLGVKAIDDKTLEITLTESVPYFPDMLYHYTTSPVHKATVEKFGEKWTDPANIVVNGPYKISEWLINDKIVLTRNPSYYDDANTTLDKVTMLAITSENTAFNRYKAGEIDVASVPSTEFDRAKKEMPDEVHVTPALCTYFYRFNTEKPPFDDVRVRRALALAVDRNIITDKVLKQGQMPAYQFTPTTTAGMVNNEPEWSKWDQAKRVEEAKKLLAEAGYDANNPLKFELLYNTSEGHKQIAVAVSSLLKDTLGVEVTLSNQEWKTFLDTVNNGNYAVSRAGWCGDYNEPSTFLNMLKTGNSNNQGKYSSAKYDDLMSQTLRPGVTPEQRANLYKQAEEQLDADMPVLNIYHYVGVSAVKPYVLNYPLKDPLKNTKFKDISIAKH